ncbi:unnamed protein product [Leptosia nina]|uniref:Uncharacterized protein n=1 Tax=Leptosia nina TaxID=320188 RepID=A0AAV1IUN3_9NEOP
MRGWAGGTGARRAGAVISIAACIMRLPPALANHVCLFCLRIATRGEYFLLQSAERAVAATDKVHHQDPNTTEQSDISAQTSCLLRPPPPPAVPTQIKQHYSRTSHYRLLVSLLNHEPECVERRANAKGAERNEGRDIAEIRLVFLNESKPYPHTFTSVYPQEQKSNILTNIASTDKVSSDICSKTAKRLAPGEGNVDTN